MNDRQITDIRGEKQVELLAPAGNMERLVAAFRYGADAVYLGAPTMSLRNFADNFDGDQLNQAISYAHSIGKKVYAAVNAFARDTDIERLPDLLCSMEAAGADAIIVNDPGVVRVANRVLCNTPLHLSTQANTLNCESALFWRDNGISRIILARELSIDDIRRMHDALKGQVELEAFVHGAMCVSYSGRCLLSNYLDGRDSNRGECVQPCRWGYEIRERGKDGEFLPIEQDGRGTYILNSRDMNMLPHIDKLIDAGICSLKIEGRMKSLFYVATVTNAYRMALDDYYRCRRQGAAYAYRPEALDELYRASHRPYCTGFALGDEERQEYLSTKYVAEYEISAVVTSYDEAKGQAIISQRNRFFDGDRLSILSPNDVLREFVVEGITNSDGERVNSAPHPQEELAIGCREIVSPGDILRRRKEG